MNIKVKNDDELSSKERQQIIELITLSFGKWDQKKRDRRYFTPTYRHLFMYDGSTLVSYLRIILRKATFNTKELLIGGVGDVCTHPDYRGKGFSTQLVGEGMELLNGAGADIGILQTDVTKGAKQYRASGFIAMNKSYIVSDIKGCLSTRRKESVMIAPIKTPEMVDQIMYSKKRFYVGKGDW